MVHFKVLTAALLCVTFQDSYTCCGPRETTTVNMSNPVVGTKTDGKPENSPNSNNIISDHKLPGSEQNIPTQKGKGPDSEQTANYTGYMGVSPKGNGPQESTACETQEDCPKFFECAKSSYASKEKSCISPQKKGSSSCGSHKDCAKFTEEGPYVCLNKRCHLAYFFNCDPNKEANKFKYFECKSVKFKDGPANVFKPSRFVTSKDQCQADGPYTICPVDPVEFKYAKCMGGGTGKCAFKGERLDTPKPHKTTTEGDREDDEPTGTGTGRDDRNHAKYVTKHHSAT